ncbi:4'-phosphopantetheine phosphatase [Anthonomus grandis grandis]|uniref:4'-phosphopantetheine phosphatase n=1 Tax=Anthonomus grandis grandis TaxID=2921223 RepID=UPI0021659ADF|nr:4'-phosphopantetheine phosphatase [Anthonomus grandis grandis]
MNNQVCPLLKDPEHYTPDIQDLSINEAARNYWLPTLQQTVKKIVAKISKLIPDNPKAEEHARLCQEKFNDLVEELKLDPRILRPLSVRTLLEFHEENFRVHFKDAWQSQKETETKEALCNFADRINFIDSIEDFSDKWLQLIVGVLAGNFFDWGSSVVANMLEGSQGFGLTQAMNTIESRPWFIDDVDAWVNRLNTRIFKQAVIFVDNAGVDFILGILPFVREFLRMGTRVVLTANSYPSLNDVTYEELNLYCCKAAQQCHILKSAIANGQLVTVENGQKGPCLDLKNIPSELCDLMTESDLIVLEGMGRSVHTNLNTEFAVDSVKLAVLKNEWLAKSLGANQFSVIFKYEPTI